MTKQLRVKRFTETTWKMEDDAAREVAATIYLDLFSRPGEDAEQVSFDDVWRFSHDLPLGGDNVPTALAGDIYASECGALREDRLAIKDEIETMTGGSLLLVVIAANGRTAFQGGGPPIGYARRDSSAGAQLERRQFGATTGKMRAQARRNGVPEDVIEATMRVATQLLEPRPSPAAAEDDTPAAPLRGEP